MQVKEEILDSVQYQAIKDAVVIYVNDFLISCNSEKKINNDTYEVSKICDKITTIIGNAVLKNKLGILYDYNNKYMELIKNYEDQLKFVASFQTELRNEITKLFTSAISDASKSLKESGLDEKVQAQYLKTYIDSQIECINMSKRYFQESVLHSVNKIQTEMVESIKEEENVPIYAKPKKED